MKADRHLATPLIFRLAGALLLFFGMLSGALGAAVMDAQSRVAKEDWTLAQSTVASDQAWQGWLAGRKQSLDSWMAKPRDRAEWISGWQHDLVDPATQASVNWRPEMPLPPDGPAAQGKFRQAWVSWGRSNNFARVVEAARIYRVTGETRYANWAASQLDFYAENYAKWPLRTWNGKGRMMGQSLDEATGAIALIEAVRLLQDYVPSSRQAHWRDELFLPIVENLRDFNQGVNNIALWHAVAISVIGMQFNDPALVSVGLDSPKGVRALLKAGVTANSLWYEGSFTYNAYVLRALAPLFVNASLTGRSASLQPEMNLAKNMLLAPMQLRFDDGFLPTPGDANSRAPALDIGLFFEMHRILDTRVGRVEAMRRKTWETLVDQFPEQLPPLEVLPSVKSAHLAATRMAMLKSGGWQVFMHYGQLIQHHAQEEALSSEIYFNDVPVVLDPGTVPYGSKLHEQYFRRAVAHNVPLVDGAGQVGWNPGVMKSFSSVSMDASQPSYRPDAAAQRKISIQGSELREVTSISLKPEIKGSRRLGFLFNTECQANLPDAQLTAERSAAPPDGTGFSFWEGTTVRMAPPRWQAELQCGKNRFKLDVTVSGPHMIYQALAPTTPLPKRRTVVYMELHGRAASVDMKITPLPANP
ncbi:MAG: heparinase II/III family protein [Ferribacterium limneticum]